MNNAPLLLAAINHLLGQAQWARERLRPQAGRHARLDITPLTLVFTITPEGTLTAAAAETAPEVTLTLALGEALAASGGGLNALMAKAQINGAADLADTLVAVFSHLRWDAEEDLAKLIGDIAAHRLLTTGERLAQAPLHLGRALADSIGGYLANEAAPLVTRPESQRLAAETHALATRLAALEKRLDRLCGP
ncbi:MAG: SCP2 sterol-binding domain-containing protein [Azoarcus sp.]|jgi:ubiquinone biosynthesis protein UbiJ|nr:SCP2 sterol-binding domain-containing protein [Azoarcus sp.]